VDCSQHLRDHRVLHLQLSVWQHLRDRRDELVLVVGRDGGMAGYDPFNFTSMTVNQENQPLGCYATVLFFTDLSIMPTCRASALVQHGSCSPQYTYLKGARATWRLVSGELAGVARLDARTVCPRGACAW